MNKAAVTDPPNTAAGSHISGAFVRTMICLMVLLTLGMVCLVFYRSQSFVEPTAAAIVVGDRSLDGTEVSVMLNGREVVGATLTADNKYATPLMLQPGVYELDAVCNGERLLSQQFGVASRTFVTVDLPTTVALQGDASLDGAAVQLSGPRGGPSTVVLNPENSFAAILYRTPGRYHLNVTHNGRIIRNEQIDVAAHKPRNIDLNSRLDSDRLLEESK
jgi:hypothetical protein